MMKKIKDKSNDKENKCAYHDEDIVSYGWAGCDLNSTAKIPKDWLCE